MKQEHQALKVAFAAARQLPTRLQKQLAEQLITASIPDKQATVVYLHRLSQKKQARLTKLLDKNNEGRLSPAERSELKRLGRETDELLLANSQALARALRPELFDERDRLRTSRLRQALREAGMTRTESQPKNAHR